MYSSFITKNKVFISIMVVITAILASIAIFSSTNCDNNKHNNVYADEDRYVTNTTVINNVSYDWYTEQEPSGETHGTAKVVRITMGNGADSNYVLPSYFQISSGNTNKIYDIVELSNGSQSINSVFGPSKNRITKADFTNGYLTTIGDYVLYNCDLLTDITIPATVTSIGTKAFAECDNLARVGYRTNNVTTVGNNVFLNSGSPSTWVLNLKDDNSITKIPANLFNNATGLNRINNYSSLVEIGTYAFANSGLNNFAIPSTITTIGNGAFANCAGLILTSNSTTFTVNDNNLYKNVDNSCELLACMPSKTSIALPSNCTAINSGAFVGCTNLVTITANGNSVFTIDGGCLYKKQDSDQTKCELVYCPANVTNLVFKSNCTSVSGFAFINAHQFTSITYPNGGSISIPDNMFKNCTSLTSIDLSGVTTIGNNAFNGCTGLTNITIPSSVTTIGTSAFNGCINVDTINYNANITGLTQVNRFSNVGINCENGTTVNIGSNVSKIPNSLFFSSGTSIAPKITNVTFANGSSCTEIGDYAFQSCKYLANINLPNTIKSIGMSAFNDCYALHSIALPNNLEKIDDDAFKSSGLNTQLVLPSSLQEINENAFYDCQIVGVLEIPSSVTTIGENAFNSCQATKVKFVRETISGLTVGTGAFLNGASGVVYAFRDTTANIDAWKDGSNNKYFNTNNFSNTTYNYLYKLIFKNNGNVCDTIYDISCMVELPKLQDTQTQKFAGWKIANDTNTYSQYTISNSDVMFDAYWKTYYTVTLNRNGGTGGTEFVLAASGETFDQNIEIPTHGSVNGVEYRFDGYEFIINNNTKVKYFNADGTPTTELWGDESNGLSLTAIWVQVYTIEFIVDGNKCTYTGDLIQLIDNGNSLTVPMITPKNGYTFNGWSSDIVTNPTANATYTAQFITNEYTVTFENGTGYTITATKNGVTFNSGDKVTVEDTIAFTINCNNGYSGSLSISTNDDKCTFADNTNTLSNVWGDITIACNTTLTQYTLTYSTDSDITDKYTVSAKKNTNNDISSGGNFTVEDALLLTITYPFGYEISAKNNDESLNISSQVNGNQNEATITLHTGMTSNVNIVITKTLIEYAITFVNDDSYNYTITATKNNNTFSSGDVITKNDSVKFEITAKNGYNNATLSASSANNKYNWDSSTFTLSDVYEEVTITGQVEAIQYTLTYNSDSHCTIKGYRAGIEISSGSPITIEDVIEFVVEPSIGYSASLQVPNSDQYTLDGCILSKVCNDIEVQATSTINKYKVSLVCGSGIEGFEGNDGEYDYDTGLTVIATLKDHYHGYTWYINDIIIDENTTGYTFLNIGSSESVSFNLGASDIVIKVESNIDTHTINFSSNNTTLGDIDTTAINNIAYGTEIKVQGKDLYIGEQKVTGTGVSVEDNNYKNILVGWKFNSEYITGSAMTWPSDITNGSTLTIQAVFEYRLVAIENEGKTASVELDNGVATDSKFITSEIDLADVNQKIEVPKNKDAIVAYNINVCNANGDKISTNGDAVVKIAISEDLSNYKDIQVIIYDVTSDKVTAVVGEYNNGYITFRSNMLGEALVVATKEVSFPIILIIVITLLALFLVALVIWYIFKERKVAVDQNVEGSKTNDNEYDSLLAEINATNIEDEENGNNK